jgi:cation transport ATPase
VENAPEHVIAAAITKLASRELGELPEVGTFAGLAGLGARGEVDGHRLVVGFTRLIDAPRRPRSTKPWRSGKAWAARRWS